MPEETAAAGDDGLRVLTEAEQAALVMARHQHVRQRGVHSGPVDASPIALSGSAHDAATDTVRKAARLLPSRPLHEVLEGRRSHNTFAPLEVHELLAVLIRSYRIQDAGTNTDGATWTLRPVPSAGATHPFDLLVTARNVTGLEPGQYLFDAHRGGLHVLDDHWNAYADQIEQASLRAARRTLAPPASIALIAQASRVTARYSAALTLMLRDAGVLLQTMHLVAEDLGLASRILGTAGHTPDPTSQGITHGSAHKAPNSSTRGSTRGPVQGLGDVNAGGSLQDESFIVDCGVLILGCVSPE